jgi:diguanylate cyclase (GGDEF)-like protein
MPELHEERELILIIDDSVDTIRLLSGMLKGLADILFATSGEAGIRLALQRKPQLILLDVTMPEMDGYEVCRRLKADPATRDCTVVFVTASTGMDAEIRALEGGAVDFIVKPLNPPIVRARVSAQLTLQRHAMALARLENRDGLTGLYNRGYFDEQLDKECLRHQRQKLHLGVAIIDIDYFKAYNENYGHAEGDACLKKVAEAIGVATRRPGEVVARYGGEEFGVILPYTSADEAQRYGEWICRHISELNIPHDHSPVARTVTVSVGAASFVPWGNDAAQKLIAAAEQALHQAKSQERNCSVLAIER